MVYVSSESESSSESEEEIIYQKKHRRREVHAPTPREKHLMTLRRQMFGY